MKRFVYAFMLAVLTFSAAAPALADENPSKRLKGQVLLSVQDSGKLWYVLTNGEGRVPIEGASAAWRLIKQEMIGVSNSNLERIPKANNNTGSSDIVNRLRGRFLLAVQANGEIWYVNPNDGLRYNLGKRGEVYDSLKDVALGIRMDELKTIPVQDDFFHNPVTPDPVRDRFRADARKAFEDFLLLEEELNRFVNDLDRFRGRRRFDPFIDRFDGFHRRFDPIDGRFHRLRRDFDDRDFGGGFSDFENRFNRFNQEFNQFENRFQQFETEFERRFNNDTFGGTTYKRDIEEIKASLDDIEFTDAQMGWEFVNTLSQGYEDLHADKGFYPEIKWFENVFEWNQAVYMDETGFTLDPSQTQYWEWNQFDGQFFKYYYDHFNAEVLENGELEIRFELPASVQNEEYGKLEPGVYYWTTESGLMSKEEYQSQKQGTPQRDPSEIDPDQETARIIDVVQTVREGLGAYSLAHRGYPIVEGQPIKLGEGGFTQLSQFGGFWEPSGQVYIEHIPDVGPTTDLTYSTRQRDYVMRFSVHGTYKMNDYLFQPGIYEAHPTGYARVGDIE